MAKGTPPVGDAAGALSGISVFGEMGMFAGAGHLPARPERECYAICRKGKLSELPESTVTRHAGARRALKKGPNEGVAGAGAGAPHVLEQLDGAVARAGMPELERAPECQRVLPRQNAGPLVARGLPDHLPLPSNYIF